MIDPDRLMAHPIPEVVQSYGPRESAFYALSIGVGRDPMDRGDLRFAGTREPVPFPTLPLVLGHPGFWLADPATGVDATRVVHGGQGITLHAPLPVRGTVVGRTRITGLIDKGAGRGALLLSEKELRDAGTGLLYATTRSTTVLRGDGGFGGSSGPAAIPHALPETPPDATRTVETRPEQALWYRWNGDDNPLHYDPDEAARAGFARPILHGLCTLGIAAHAVLRTLCGGEPSRFRGLDARFTAPVMPGETLGVDLWADGSFRVRFAGRDVVAIGNGLARIDG